MGKIGFLLNNLGASQIAYWLINNLNKFLENSYLTDTIVFYENPSRPTLFPHFATMPIVEAWSYDGAIVATDLSTAQKLLNFPSAKEKFFYVWDLEWTRQAFGYSELKSIYGNPSINIFARSEEHKRIIEDAWNREVEAIIEDFDLEKILEKLK